MPENPTSCLETADFDELMAHVQPGITSVIGSGGKTTLIKRMAARIRETDPSARIVLTTTTHIYPFVSVKLVTSEGLCDCRADGRPSKDSEVESSGVLCSRVDIEGYESAEHKAVQPASSGLESLLGQVLDAEGIACVGEWSGPGNHTGKLKAPLLTCERLAQLADYVLVEADGSKHLPLKAHANHEPVIPEGNNYTILVVGTHGLGQPISKATHRPELFAERAGCSSEIPATKELVGRVITNEMKQGMISPNIIYWSEPS